MPENARHPFMHRTDSLDYAVVLSGEITMLLDDETGDRVLRPGDVVIQRGTNHAWANRGDEPCVMMFVMLDGVTQRDAPLAEQTGIPRR
ncbi:cupin domain-containing protein [Aestuariibius sp. HNIBRBA575]|uniref:cupin domain-containing protein n=1 Tax=Aestuariibius sp. HNIBRBA575 TaxID=3233343 RepID=UPI0034A40069